ncbi:MAG: hypothetical protein K9N49_10625 [Candidatus Marinimicrobia bacterium]|nr:hypothetical protein [Candidatus Neomarinimicrobiota bacterium]
MTPSRPMAAGIHPGPGPLHVEPGRFASAYLYVPPQVEDVGVGLVEEVQPYNWRVQLETQAGELLGETVPRTFMNYLVYTPDQARKDSVLRLRLTGKSAGAHLHVVGVPFVLCPDPETAANIRGGLDIDAKGRQTFHHSQRVLDAWADGLTDDDLRVELAEVDLGAITDTVRNSLLTELPELLGSQNLDANAPDFGAFPDLAAARKLADIAGWDNPVNPYYAQPALVRRVLLGIRPHMRLLSPYFWYERGHDFPKTISIQNDALFSAPLHSNWHTTMGLDSLPVSGPAVALKDVMHDVLPPEVIAAWRQSLDLRNSGRLNMHSGEIVNQWLYSMNAALETWKFTGNPRTLDMVRDALRTIMTPGLLGRMNPDPTPYQSALGYGRSADSGRTGAGYLAECYGYDIVYGAWCQERNLAGILSIVDEPLAHDYLESYNNLREHIAMPRDGRHTASWWAGIAAPNDFSSRTQGQPLLGNFARDMTHRTWPALEEEPFVRVLDNAFFFINTGNYYSTSYGGPTVPDWMDFTQAQVADGSAALIGYRDFGRGGQGRKATKADGFGAVFVRNCGPTLLSFNHNVMYANALWGRLADPAFSAVGAVDPTIVSAGYVDPVVTFDEESRILRRSARLTYAPLHVTRTMHFQDDRITVDLKMLALQDIEFTDLYESLPFMADERTIRLFNDQLEEAADFGADAEPASTAPAVDEAVMVPAFRAFEICGETGAGATIVFDRSYPAQLSQAFRYRPETVSVRSFSIALPKSFRAGEQRQMRYVVYPHQEPMDEATLTGLALATLTGGRLHEPHPTDNIEGPFMAEALAFYFVHPGGPLSLTLEAEVPDGPAGRRAGGSGTGTLEDPKILYRFFDHQENMVQWVYKRLEPNSVTRWHHDFGAEAPAGVYQIRYAGQGLRVNAWATPERAFGISPMRTRISHATRGQFESLWFLVPPGTDRFTLASTGMAGRVEDAAGELVADFAHGRSAAIDAADREDRLLRLRFDDAPTGAYHQFGFSGIDPLILCSDPETAAAIESHFKRRPDGTLFKHHFQVRMQEWIDELTPADLAIEPANLADYEEHWLAYPEEAAGLLGAWGAFSLLDFVLRDQDVDPESPTFGGFETRAADSILALAYSLDRPYNPYYKHPVILNRLLLSVFRNLLRLNANDTWSTSDSSYSGGDAMAPDRFEPLQLAAAAIEDPELLELWIAGVRRLADRFPFYRVTCDNQSAHWPLVYWALYEATGYEGYKRLAADYIAGMVLPEKNRFMQTGYQGEAYGPDATYQGLGAAIQALYYRLSGDVNAREGLRRIYHFFNHTVAPEPDGRIFGASGFAHRTRGSWADTQYGGGFGYMAGELPEAAVWRRSGTHALTPAEIRANYRGPAAAIRSAPQVISYSTHVIGPYWQNFRFPTEPLENGVFPAMEEENFWRNFNNEFLAVKRDHYYFVAYLAGTAAEWVKSGRKTRPDAEVHPNNKWNAVQGAQLFWTPGYGSLFTSMNWGADTLQMVRADLADGSCSFPDYWSVRATVIEEENRLRLYQQLFDLPVRVERHVTFTPDALEQRLVLHADGKVNVAALYEQLPLLHNKPGFTLRFRHEGAWRDEPGPADAFWVGNEAGAGVLVTLDNAHDITLGAPQAFRTGQAILPLRIMFPPTLEEGRKLSLNMVIKARSYAQLEE